MMFSWKKKLLECPHILWTAGGYSKDEGLSCSMGLGPEPWPKAAGGPEMGLGRGHAHAEDNPSIPTLPASSSKNCSSAVIIITFEQIVYKRFSCI